MDLRDDGAGLKEFEVAALWFAVFLDLTRFLFSYLLKLSINSNLCPETSEQALSLIPTLTRF
jgi:hypothetical protein